MSRPLRLAGYIAIGIVAGLLLAGLAIFILTRTEWGLERARRFAIAWLDERVAGELRIGRVTGPGLLRGVIVHDFEIIDERGRRFAYADSVELDYDLRTLLGGSIVLRRVVLHQPEVNIERLPGDTVWNYQEIFADTVPEPEPRERSLILFEDAVVRNGTVAIRMPYEPDGPITPEDTARILVERVPGGLVRVLRFEEVGARLDRVIWESPLEPGQLFDVASLTTRGFVWSEPFVVRNARGTLTARDSIISFDFPEVRLPGTDAGVLGRFVARTGPNDIDVRVDGRRVSLADLQWLYPPLPDEGGGSLVLRIQSRPDGTLWYAEDVRLQTPGTSIAGTLGIVTGDTLYFTQVNLRASPLDVQLLEDLLPVDLPVDGLLVGTVEVRGPLSSLETSGDLRLAGGVGDGSHVAWRGVFDARTSDVVARSMDADVKRLELALLSAFNPALRMDGSVSGHVSGSGRRDRLAFSASLVHAAGDGARSSFDGGGTVHREGTDHALDLTVEATPASLGDLAHYVPALRGFEGELRGPVHLTGTTRDLRFDGRLLTAAGPVTLDGRVQRLAGAPHVSARARVQAFALHAIQPELPELFVSGALELDVTGDGLAASSGTARLELDSARVASVPLGRVSVGGRLAEGVFAVDSAFLEGRAGVARARGSIALIEGRAGELELGYITESLAPLEVHVMGEPESPDDPPRLAGRIDATARLTGWIGNLHLEATARGEGLVYGAANADGVRVDLAGTGLRSGAPAQWRLVARADSAEAWSHPLHAARFEAAGTLDSLALMAGAGVAREERLAFAGTLVRHEDGGTTLHAGGLRIGAATPWVLAAPASVRFADGEIRLGGVELQRGTGGAIHAAGRLAWAPDAVRGSPLDFQVALSGVPFVDVLGALRSTSDGDGEVDATLRIYGTPLDPVIEGEVFGRNLRYNDVRFDRVFAEINYTALGLDAHAEAQYGGRSILTGGGRIPLDLRLTGVERRRLDEPLRFTIVADSLPLALPLSMIDGFTAVQGRLGGRVAFGGTTLNPALSGGFILTNGGADWDVTGVRYRDVHGTFTIERDRLLRVAMDARAVDPRGRGVALLAAGGGGTGTITGTLDLSDLTDPGFDLRFNADRVFAARRRDVEATVTGVITLGGSYRRPEIGGGVRVDQGALYVDEIYRQYLVVGFDDLSAVDTSLVALTPVLGNVIASARNPFLRNLWVRDLQLRVGTDSWLRSRDMDVEVSGDLAVSFDRRVEGDLRLAGSLDVERGTYTLYYPPLQSRRFVVRQGTIDFPGTPGIDPNLSITAAYRARARGEPLDVLAVVSGTLQNPRVRLTSETRPDVGESDLASFLFFGVPSWELASMGAGTADVRAVAGLGMRALTPSVLGYASSGLQTLVQSAGLFDYAALTTAEVTPQPNGRALTSLFGPTQLELGRYIAGNLFVGYTQPLGVGTFDPAGRIEWRFLPNYTLEIFAEDRYARAFGFGLRPHAELKRKVLGFSLFREWGF